MAKRRPTKEALYYKGLQDTIYPLVHMDLKNAKEIEEAAMTYQQEQTYLKRLNASHKGRNLIIYIIGERFIELAMEALEEKADFDITYTAFEDYVFRKVHGIGLFQLVVPAPELIPTRLIQAERGKMKQAFHHWIGRNAKKDELSPVLPIPIRLSR